MRTMPASMTYIGPLGGADPQQQMKRTNKCPKCGSSDVITDAKAIDRVDNGALSVATFRKPEAVVSKAR